MKWLISSLLLIILSCNGQKRSALTTGEDKAQNTDSILSLILSDSYSGADEAETLVITDAKSLQKFYSKINRTRKPGLPIPDIDFSKESIVIQCGGKQDGLSVPELYVMHDSEQKLVIGVKQASQKSTDSAVTTPFSVYKMPVTQQEIIFKKGQ